jgi:hypothetical protein
MYYSKFVVLALVWVKSAMSSPIYLLLDPEDGGTALLKTFL